MTRNLDTAKAWEYHNRTKHSPVSVRRNVRSLDWDNHPLPFKIYRDLQPLSLPQETGQTGAPALAAIAAGTGVLREAAPNLKQLTHLLYYSAGITKRRRYPGGEILFRAAACTGALYEIELYLVCGALPDLAAGVYHFSPGDLALRRLREGDCRGNIASTVSAPAFLVATGAYWRNAWKYQARTYRHFGWDNGTIHANLLAVASALGLPARLMCGFVDDDVSRLLDLDTDREVSLSLLALGHTASAPPAPAAMTRLQLSTVPLSKEEVNYPAMREIHAASSLDSQAEVAAWRARAIPLAESASASAGWKPLEPLTDEQLPSDTIEEVVLRRGSSRRFCRDPITFTQLSTMLDRSTRGIAADFLALGAQINGLYLIVHAVEGLPPGAYFYDGVRHGLEPLRTGDLRQQAAFLALEQDLAGDAAVAVFFLADLHSYLDRLGNRGYRAAQLEAGILGGKLYLAAYAQHLGATGLTFYDDEVVQFFSPHAEGKSAIFLVAIGHPARRSA